METKDTDKYIDRPFNIRPMCFWAFFVVLTIIVCKWAMTAGVIWIGLYFAVLIGAFVGLQFINTKDKVLKFLGTSRMFFVVLIVLTLVTAVSFALNALAYTNQKTFAGYKELSGTIESCKTDDSGSGWFVLTDARFDGASVSGKVQVYTDKLKDENVNKIVTTQRVKVTVQLRTADANNYYINSGVKYTANIKTNDDIVQLGKDNSGRSVVMRYSRDFLAKFLGNRNADLMYSMLLGDKSTLDGEIQQSFSLTGLAHVLAVSGLHVGLITGLLMALFKILRMRRKMQVPFIAAILLFYCYLCGFRYSILRASIMFLVFAVRRLYLRSNDLLSSLSAAAIVVLILFPYSLYSASFQLSFACMFGIALFHLPFSSFFKKLFKKQDSKILSWLSDGIAMYFATTITCLPLLIKYFGFISLVGLLANLILLPLLVLAFQACIAALITYIAFPLLYLIDVILNAVIGITNWMARLSFSHLKISSPGGDLFLIYFIGLILTTRFIFMRRSYKYGIAAVLIAIYILSLAVYNIV